MSKQEKRGIRDSHDLKVCKLNKFRQQQQTKTDLTTKTYQIDIDT